MTPPTTLSTSEARRESVINSAVVVFAQSGYLGTPIAAVAEHAQISPAYVFKLFPRKEELFVAALDRCFERIMTALRHTAQTNTDPTPDGVLAALGHGYAALISDRSLLMLQVHAQSAANVPDIGAALQRGLERVTTFLKSESGAPDEAVQRFIAYGQLCHLITVTSLDHNPADWARLLTAGIKHPDEAALSGG